LIPAKAPKRSVFGFRQPRPRRHRLPSLSTFVYSYLVGRNCPSSKGNLWRRTVQGVGSVQIRSAVRSSSKAQHRQLLPSSPPCGANEDSYTGEREMQGLRDGYFNDHRLSSARDAEGVLFCSVSYLRWAINSHSASHRVRRCSLSNRRRGRTWFGANFTRRRLAKNSHARQRPHRPLSQMRSKR
jgi:hypothetical protein